ncbi:MAG: M23 family metallopeptidase [Clostridia bacterium]|nr:M23 family metallopeptidase [Clostridia bacterium]
MLLYQLMLQQLLLHSGGVWPTTATYISSPFGYRWGSLHTGMDIAGRGGDPIYAYKDGLVTFSGWGGAYGYMLKIDHGNGVATWYAHCSALYVSAGTTVKMGQTIAAEGTTGNSTGNHLHFEIRINGVAVDPYPYF